MHVVDGHVLPAIFFSASSPTPTPIIWKFGDFISKLIVYGLIHLYSFSVFNWYSLVPVTVAIKSNKCLPLFEKLFKAADFNTVEVDFNSIWFYLLVDIQTYLTGL